MIKCPDVCLVCGSQWSGGQLPFAPMEDNLRAYYDCGSSVSVKTIQDGVYLILFKNCGGRKIKEGWDD